MNHRKKVLVTVGGLLSCLFSYANSCPGQKWTNWSVGTVQREIRSSDVIFLGEVIASEDFNYTMRVIDVFKGNIASDTLHGMYRNKCYLPPGEGIWIVYSKLENTDKGIMLKELSSLSRSISHPLSNNIPMLLPPPTPETRSDSAAMVRYYKEEENYIEAQEAEMLPMFLKNWMNEYALLTAYRNQAKASETEEESGDNSLTYVALGLALIALLVGLLKK